MQPVSNANTAITIELSYGKMQQTEMSFSLFLRDSGVDSGGTGNRVILGPVP